MAREKETLSLVRESERPARLLVKGRAGNAPEFRRIMRLTRPTSVPKAPTLFAYRDVKLLSRVFYGFESCTEDGDEEMKRMRSNVSTFEKTTLVCVFLYPFRSIDGFI